VDNVGTVPAALTTYLAIQAFKPDIVISAGEAGGSSGRLGALLGSPSFPSGVSDRLLYVQRWDHFL
jgi:5'-methylthioadenosine nucleosidase